MAVARRPRERYLADLHWPRSDDTLDPIDSNQRTVRLI
jgi:hypothetical protein